MGERTKYFQDYYLKHKEANRKRNIARAIQWQKDNPERYKSKHDRVIAKKRQAKVQLAYLCEMWKDYFGESRKTTAYPSMVGRSMAM